MLSPSMLLLWFPVRVENRIWGDGNGTFHVTLAVQGFVRCDAGSQWLIVVPKSKDWFMERKPMKTVQPCAYMGMAWHSMW
jgi:hypothetical protein